MPTNKLFFMLTVLLAFGSFNPVAGANDTSDESDAEISTDFMMNDNIAFKESLDFTLAHAQAKYGIQCERNKTTRPLCIKKGRVCRFAVKYECGKTDESGKKLTLLNIKAIVQGDIFEGPIRIKRIKISPEKGFQP